MAEISPQLMAKLCVTRPRSQKALPKIAQRLVGFNSLLKVLDVGLVLPASGPGMTNQNERWDGDVSGASEAHGCGVDRGAGC